MAPIDTIHGEDIFSDLIGRGGMEPTRVGRYTSGHRVIVKRPRDPLPLDELNAAPSGGEGRASRRVSHPNVVRVFDHGVDADGAPSTVTEPVRGVVLRELVLREGPLPLARIRGLAWQLLDGLAAIHAAGIVHADIKCDNLIVDTTGGTDHLTIIDFGLVRATSRSVLGQAIVAGTPEYLAPELVRGVPPTAAADLYSAAIVIYELLVGMTPFAGGLPLEVLERQLAAPIVFPAQVRASISLMVERVLLRALEKEPQRRFPDARSFAISFDRAIGMLPGGERPARATEAVRAVPVRDSYRDPETEPVQRRRRDLDEALDGETPEPIVVAYLALADALIADDRMGAGLHELEGALPILRARWSEPPASLWRVESLLAAMYELLGNPVRARRVAMDAHTHAVRAGCKIAERSTRALLHRLMSSRRPLQRVD